MPWEEQTTMSLRTEFIQLILSEEADMSQACQHYHISRKTGYKWLYRYREGGEAALADRSRRPLNSPFQTCEELEKQVILVRQTYPTWGGRKIEAYLHRMNYDDVPSASTITAILWRNNLIDPEEASKHRPFQRFEYDEPNQLWQMDFKGYFPLTEGGTCHPLTVIDDHSRFLIGLKACPNETRLTVQGHLTSLFRNYGLPDRMLMDNGSPWGTGYGQPYTELTVWLIRIGVGISHGKPFNPQTQGKDERLHRTLDNDLLKKITWNNHDQCQIHFDAWREIYNWQRPHEALKMDVPGTLYRASIRAFPEQLPPIQYDPQDQIRKVDIEGHIFFHNRRFRVSKALRHQLVAIRPTADGIYDVFFCKQKVATISLIDNNDTDGV
jgi:transposase InsO family protein